jgi:hypothetical protein
MEWLNMLPQDAQAGVKWVIGPSVVPWVGAVSAILAAFLTAPGSWLKHFWGMLPRAVLVVVFWFAGIWLINYGLTNYVGTGPRGAGGSPGAGDGVIPNGAAANPLPRPDGATTPGSQAPTAVIDVRFLHDPANPGVARNLACDVEGTGAGVPLKLPVRANSRDAFVRQFLDSVRAFTVPPGAGTVVRIHRKPEPGEGSVQALTAVLKGALPSAEVRVESE